MKNIVLDTDLGADSDDAVALALLLKAERESLCKILAVTVCTTRDGAVETVNAFSEFYNGRKIPVGKMSSALKCDEFDYYVKDIKDRYKVTAESQSAVRVLRRALATSAEKVTVVAIGPLRNVCELLKSPPDEYSPLCGRDLFAEKVERLYVMGGVFKENVPEGRKVNPKEWNIAQDVNSAISAIKLCPTDIIFSPFEVGVAVKSTGHKRETPMWYCMKGFADASNLAYDDEISRFSWDPVTVMAAIEKEDWRFCYSECGDVEITEQGECVFTPNGGGKCRYISTKTDLNDVQNKLNDYIKEE